MARSAARQREPHPDALPQWIRPQLTELVKQAPEGRDWLHEIHNWEIILSSAISVQPFAPSTA
jgi:hypothetical protein